MKNVVSIIITLILIIGAFFLFRQKELQTEAKAYEKIISQTSDEKEFLLNRFIVKYKNSIPVGSISSQAMNISSSPKKKKAFTVSVNQAEKTNLNSKSENVDKSKKDKMLKELRQKMSDFAQDENVEYVQPVYIYRTSWADDSPQATPDDYNPNPPSAQNEHWYYDKANLREMWHDQGCHTGGTDCGGNSEVTVAVIDTGLAYETRNSNYKLVDEREPEGNDTEAVFEYQVAPEYDQASGFNLYTNEDEADGDPATNCHNGLDDDGNGYIDDCNGYNAYEDWICDHYTCTNTQRSEQGHPNDDYGHGTFVTGGIASLVDNGSGSISPAFNLTVMPIKASERITHSVSPGSLGPSFYTDDLCNSIDYARENGADVINMSIGGGSYDEFIESCINDAYNAGITLVAASGNSNSEVDYPAAFENVIAVGATDSGDNKASYSNYGENLDLVAAVGDNSGSYTNSMWQQSYECFASDSCHEDVTTNYKSYSVQSGLGTSYASPQVAAAAGLIKSKKNKPTPSQLKNILIHSANGSKWNNQTGRGIIDYETLNLNIWSDYTSTPELTASRPDITEFNGRLYQAIQDKSDKIRIRSTADGVFNNEPDEEWSFDPNGKTTSSVTLEAFEESLYLVVRGTSNRIFTKRMSTSEVWDSTWQENGGLTSSDVGMATFNPGSGNRLYQSVKGLHSDRIFVRFTEDGVFDTAPEESWQVIDGLSSTGVSLESFNNKLFLSVAGISKRIFIRSTSDGIFDDNDLDENWKEFGGLTDKTPVLTTNNGKIFQSAKE